MLTYDNIVGNQEDWAQFVTNVEMVETPFLDWLPVEDKPVNVEYSYQADAYDAPAENSHVDGEPWQSFKAAGDSRARLRAVVQWFDKTTSVSKLSQDVANPAGIEDELARDIAKRLKEMARDKEANFLENWDSRSDDGTVGYRTRAVGSWIQTGAQSDRPVISNFRPPTDSVNATASGSLTEDIFRDILESMGRETKSKELITAFAGPKSKRAISDMPLFTPATTVTTTGIAYKQDNASRTLTRIVDSFNSDFGPVDVMLSWWNNQIDGAAVTNNYTVYFCHSSKWALRWNQQPQVYRPEFKGGSYEAAMDCIAMLVCKNPRGEGKYEPTS